MEERIYSLEEAIELYENEQYEESLKALKQHKKMLKHSTTLG